MFRRALRSSETPTLILRAFSLIISLLVVLNVVARYTYGFPLLIEGVLQIIFSEVNRRKQARRYRQYEQQSQDVEELGEEASRRTECVGAVIGYREDPAIFRRCLESYRDDTSRAARVLVVGIDGNEAEDMQMIAMAEKVRLLLAPATSSQHHEKSVGRQCFCSVSALRGPSPQLRDGTLSA